MITIASTMKLTEADEVSIVETFSDLDDLVRMAPRLERKGSPAELLTFVIEVDWSVVRDTLVSGAIAAGIPPGIQALRHAAASIGGKIKSIITRAPAQSKTDLILRSTTSDIDVQISGPEAIQPDPWLHLLDRDVTSARLKWDSDKKVWIDVK